MKKKALPPLDNKQILWPGELPYEYTKAGIAAAQKKWKRGPSRQALVGDSAERKELFESAVAAQVVTTHFITFLRSIFSTYTLSRDVLEELVRYGEAMASSKAELRIIRMITRELEKHLTTKTW